jgi:transcriptional regulator with XRE-family HTH domain
MMYSTSVSKKTDRRRQILDSSLKALNAKKIGTNLTEALAGTGWGCQRLQKGIWREHQLKVSRGTLENYREGSVAKPNPTILQAAAQVLRVSADWLLYDIGKKNLDAEAARRAHEEEFKSFITDKMESAFQEHFPAYEGLSSGAKSVAWRTWQDVRNQSLPEAGVDPMRVASAVGKALSGPLEALGIDPWDLRGRRFDNYVISACTALQFLLKED